jgi:hypothetical protein
VSFKANFKEDNDGSVLGRLTASNGTGAATGVDGEGKFIKQADVSTITYEIFDLEAPTTVAFSGTLLAANVILDTVVTSNEIWTKDSTGYNFKHDLAASNFPNGGVTVLVEYTVTLSGGAILTGSYQGPVCSKRGS